MKYTVCIALLIVLILTSCANQNYIYKHRDTLTLQTPGKSIKINLKNKPSRTCSRCSMDSYTIDEDRFHLEFIRPKPGCTWSGLAEGFYKDFLKEQFRGLKKVSHLSSKGFDIYKYESNKRYFYLLSLYNASSNTFIVDYTGEIALLYSPKVKLLAKEERFSKKLDKSLLHNPFNDYFERKNPKEKSILLIPYYY